MCGIEEVCQNPQVILLNVTHLPGYMTGSIKVISSVKGYLKSSRLYKWFGLSVLISKVIKGFCNKGRYRAARAAKK